MRSPVLDSAYHHSSATPTPSNYQIKNGPANSGHSCCGKTFASEALFKEHFADKHDPKSPNYLKPEDANKKAAPEDPNAWKAVTLEDRGIEPLVPTPKEEKKAESADGPKPFGK
jgi:hypothetical protein